MIFTAEGFFEVAIESWPEWDLNPRPLNSHSSRNESQLFRATPISSISSVSDFIAAFAFLSHHVYFNRKSVEFLGVYSESIFLFIEFFSQENCFLWSPCLSLIAETIILDTPVKFAVVFFLKIISPS